MNIRKFDLVVALYIFGVITAELMGAKTFPLHVLGAHLNITVAIFVMPLLFTMTDVIVEVYGRQRARSVVGCGLVTVVLLILFSLLATSLPPSSRYAASESAYEAIFKSTIQISVASIAAFAISELLDVAVFSKLRSRLGKRALWLRNNASNVVSELADSTVFVTLAFYTFSMSPGQNMNFFVSIIVPYWFIRCVLSFLETPLVYAGVRWLRPKESGSKLVLAGEKA
jgi:uncharacterized integral membrane protein (TIGR00697 family)